MGERRKILDIGRKVGALDGDDRRLRAFGGQFTGDQVRELRGGQGATVEPWRRDRNHEHQGNAEEQQGAGAEDDLREAPAPQP